MKKHENPCGCRERERERAYSYKQKKDYKNSKILKKATGITLVALIVTIIILMILAGVVIVTVTGNNGILNKSKLARDTYQNSINEENRQISSYENEIDKATFDIASSRDDTITLSKGEYNSLIARIEALENKSTSGFEMKQLVDYITYSSLTSVETNDSISNYNYLYLVFGFKKEWYDSRIIKLDEFIKDYSNTFCNLYFWPGNGKYAHFQYVDDNHIKICCDGWGATVFGIK